MANINDKDIILDFFSGSATTAHAVMQLNAEDGGNRRYIMVQIPEKCEEASEACKAGYKNICEVGKERIRRAGKKIQAELEEKQKKDGQSDDGYKLDTGFRVLKLDSSNMKDVYYSPEQTDQLKLDLLVDNIKEDRTGEDLLFHVMLDLGISLDSKISRTQIAGKEVFNVEDDFLIACFDSEVTEEVITAIAKRSPQYAVLADRSLAGDCTATNFEQIFHTYSPNTKTKIL